MTKAEKTREFIIQKSASIFNIKGYENTSLADIQEATKLTKGAIYGNFSDKNELTIAAYNYNASLIYKHVSEYMEGQSSIPESLIAYPKFYVEKWKIVFIVGGCPLLNAAVEADDHLDVLKEPVRKSFNRFIELLCSIIQKGQNESIFKANINAKEYAALIHSIMEGNILLAKIMNDTKYLKWAANHIKKIIDQELLQ